MRLTLVALGRVLLDLAVLEDDDEPEPASLFFGSSALVELDPER